jgi:hypothetical protein
VAEPVCQAQRSSRSALALVNRIALFLFIPASTMVYVVGLEKFRKSTRTERVLPGWKRTSYLLAAEMCDRSQNHHRPVEQATPHGAPPLSVTGIPECPEPSTTTWSATPYWRRPNSTALFSLVPIFCRGEAPLAFWGPAALRHRTGR